MENGIDNDEGGGDASSVTSVYRYTCDICRSRSFDTLAEATEHEATCTGGGSDVAGGGPSFSLLDITPTLPRNQLSHASSPQPTNPAAESLPLTDWTKMGSAVTTTSAVRGSASNGGTSGLIPESTTSAMATWFKCDVCKLLFASKSQAEEHEVSCDSTQWYNCNMCNVLRFRTLEDAKRHERDCNGPRPLALLNLPVAARMTISGDSSAISAGGGGGLGTALGCGVDDDDSSVEIISVKSAPTSIPKKNAVSGSNVPEPRMGSVRSAQIAASGFDSSNVGGQEYVTVWTCDICKEAVFKSFEDATEHEKTCTGEKPAGDDTDCVGGGAKAERQGEQGEGGGVEASKKEELESQLQTQPPLLFRPVLDGPHDTKNFYCISTFHSGVLRTLDAFAYTASSRKGTTAVRFRCTYCCGEILPPGGSIWQLADALELPASQYGHLCRKCPSAPLATMSRLKLAEATQALGRMSLIEFLTEYFPANGLVGGVGPKNSLIFVSDAEFKVVPGYENTRRGKLLQTWSNQTPTASSKQLKWLAPSITNATPAPGSAMIKNKERSTDVASPAPDAKRQKVFSKTLPKNPPPRNSPPTNTETFNNLADMGATLHTDDSGDEFFMGATGGTPLLCSMSSQAAETLHRAHKTLLEQLEFFSLKDIRGKVGRKFKPLSNEIGIRCQNCITNPVCYFRQIESVQLLPDALVLIGVDHLANCKCTESSVKNDIQNLTDIKDDDSLSTYCKFITKLYGLADADDRNTVVWGDCPAVPSGYGGNPADMNIGFVSSEFFLTSDSSSQAP